MFRVLNIYYKVLPSIQYNSYTYNVTGGRRGQKGYDFNHVYYTFIYYTD